MNCSVMKNTGVSILFTLVCSLAFAQTANLNLLTVKQINFASPYGFIYGVKGAFDYDSTANNLVPNMRAVWNLFKTVNIGNATTTLYKSPALTGDGSSANPLNVDFSKVMARGTTAERDAANYPDGEMFYNTDTYQLTIKIGGQWCAFGLTPVK